MYQPKIKPLVTDTKTHYCALFLFPECIYSFSQLCIARCWLPFPFPWSPLLSCPPLPRAQNSQQTGFKGNLRLLVKTLEQPHLPFKILPAALSHCLQSNSAASTAPLLLPMDAGFWDTLTLQYKSHP